MKAQVCTPIPVLPWEVLMLIRCAMLAGRDLTGVSVKFIDSDGISQTFEIDAAAMPRVRNFAQFARDPKDWVAINNPQSVAA